jgi:hypothetical protein
MYARYICICVHVCACGGRSCDCDTGTDDSEFLVQAHQVHILQGLKEGYLENPNSITSFVSI